MTFPIEKFNIISNVQQGLKENHTLSPIETITYIDTLYNALESYRIQKKQLHFKLIDHKYNSDNPVINDIDGNIQYLTYINKNTSNQIQHFVKEKFIQSHELLQFISKIIEHNTYSIFIFILSPIGYAIPLIIDGNDIKLEITHNHEIVFMSSHFEE